MKAPILSPVTFDPAARTVTLTGLTVDLQRLYVIVNLTRNVIYYAAGRVGAGTTVSDAVITLPDAGLMASHQPTDELLVLYEQNDPQIDLVVSRLSDLLVELSSKADTTDLAALAQQATLAALNSKIPATAASEATLDAVRALLSTLSSATHIEDTPHSSGHPGLLLLAIRSDNDGPTANDGDYTTIKLDEAGRVKTASQPASYPDIIGDITAVQASISTPVAGGTVEANVNRASNIMLFCMGTFSGVNVTFEGSLEPSGDNNWFGIQACRSNANTIETATGSLSATPAYAWELSVNGLARVRVRCTARTSGTQSWRFKLGTYATEPIPALQTHAVTQSGSWTQTSQPGMSTSANGAPNTTRIVSAASTNLTSVTGSATAVASISVSNNSPTDGAYVKLYNKATAPVLTSDVPADILYIPPRSGYTIPYGIYPRFSLGLALAIVGGAADTDTTAVAANQVTVSIRRA